MTKFIETFVKVICCAALLLFFLGSSLARDLGGKFDNSLFKQWFDSLARQSGLLLIRRWLDGQWIEVPPEALVTVPNKFGTAVVWPYTDVKGNTQVRCLMPGAGR